jgi:hypothetical protein
VKFRNAVSLGLASALLGAGLATFAAPTASAMTIPTCTVSFPSKITINALVMDRTKYMAATCDDPAVGAAFWGIDYPGALAPFDSSLVSYFKEPYDFDGEILETSAVLKAYELKPRSDYRLVPPRAPEPSGCIEVRVGVADPGGIACEQNTVNFKAKYGSNHVLKSYRAGSKVEIPFKLTRFTPPKDPDNFQAWGYRAWANALVKVYADGKYVKTIKSSETGTGRFTTYSAKAKAYRFRVIETWSTWGQDFTVRR